MMVGRSVDRAEGAKPQRKVGGRVWDWGWGPLCIGMFLYVFSLILGK
jgi:hypothetical protein